MSRSRSLPSIWCILLGFISFFSFVKKLLRQQNDNSAWNGYSPPPPSIPIPIPIPLPHKALPPILKIVPSPLTTPSRTTTPPQPSSPNPNISTTRPRSSLLGAHPSSSLIPPRAFLISAPPSSLPPTSPPFRSLPQYKLIRSFPSLSSSISVSQAIGTRTHRNGTLIHTATAPISHIYISHVTPTATTSSHVIPMMIITTSACISRHPNASAAHPPQAPANPFHLDIAFFWLCQVRRYGLGHVHGDDAW
ncbi:hypothetical protein BV22DRAFT_1127842 [Leucogyrophana mollusca]|uniref:Uncharacterized protein n=1 Tax=Leucogyrophana mollusca TaxID=85980 RepID=A0ACB8BPQ3_9AGAM|nr:hypothetical protein BV22DRAFT_1127842 [Leucogyrophana mollusca]